MAITKSKTVKSTKTAKTAKVGTKAKSKSTPPASKPSRKKLPTSKRDQVKTKRPKLASGSILSAPARRTKKQYTAEELGIPKMNGIVPVGVQKPKGGKKGKVFVDDGPQMLTILKMVEAERTKDVESKVMRARQLEEIREARRQDEEKRSAQKNEKLEKTKNQLRGKKRNLKGGLATGPGAGHIPTEDVETNAENGTGRQGKKKKRVSFG